MGINAQTSVPKFTSGDVLTAANTNLLTNAPPVFAGTATRDAAFGGAGEKTLAEGQLCYLEDSNIVQYYDGAAWATVGPATASAITLISATTIGTTVSSVTVSGAFSATYDAYKIVVTGGAGSTANAAFQMKLGASTTGYYYTYIYNAYANGVSGVGAANQTALENFGCAGTNGIQANIEIQNPFLAKYTSFQAQNIQTNLSGMATGMHQVATSYTDFTLTPAAGTITGGTVRVYGYQNS